MPYLTTASAFVFSRRAYVWDGLDPACVQIIPPCIDPFTAKNQDLGDETVSGILQACGIVAVPPKSAASRKVTRPSVASRDGRF